MPTDLPPDDTLWTTPTPAPNSWLQGDEVTVTCLPATGATLVSGDLDGALAARAPGAPLLGLLGAEPAGPFALRVARDRALLVTPDPLDAAPGWYGTYALSPADNLYLCLAVEGARAEAVQSACLSAPPGSPSAATSFGDSQCLVSRGPDALHVRVPAPEAAALWLRLSRLIA